MAGYSTSMLNPNFEPCSLQSRHAEIQRDLAIRRQELAFQLGPILTRVDPGENFTWSESLDRPIWSKESYDQSRSKIKIEPKKYFSVDEPRSNSFQKELQKETDKWLKGVLE